MITGSQIRGARAMIGLSIEDLASAADVSLNDVRTLEADQSFTASTTIAAIKGALEALGIIFLASGNQDEGGPGIRLKSRSHGDHGIRPENLNATNDD